MKNRVLILMALVLFQFKYFFSTAQTTRDTNDIAVGITNYFFAHNTKITNGSLAIGPSFLLTTNGRIAIHISALVDLRKYKYYEYNHFQTDTFIELNFFLPIFFQYNYYMNNNINCFFTAGIVIGGNHYIDENYETKKTGAFSIIAGTGFSYRIIKRLQMRAFPTMRYCERNFFPGLLLDISFPFSSNKCL